MAKRRKRGKQPATNRPSRPKPFNPALRTLGEAPIVPAESEPEAAPPIPQPLVAAAPSEEELFRLAVAGVSPLPADQRVEPPRPPPATAPERGEDETSEALARLADLCAGVGPFDFADTAEYIEGSAPGINRRLVKKLRRGDFSVQAHFDLHGMTRDEAREAVDRFISQARARGLRCVLLIHGRGLNSKDQIPVLKQKLSAWLLRGRLGRQVLAFATARPSDGGAGALYVLLKR